MEIVSIEKKTFEELVAKFDRFVRRMGFHLQVLFPVWYKRALTPIGLSSRKGRLHRHWRGNPFVPLFAAAGSRFLLPKARFPCESYRTLAFSNAIAPLPAYFSPRRFPRQCKDNRSALLKNPNPLQRERRHIQKIYSCM